MNDESKKSNSAALAGSVGISGGIAGAGFVGAPVLAQSAGNSDITSAVSSLSGIQSAAAPIAIGVLVFAIGALLIKRLMYS